MGQVPAVFTHDNAHLLGGREDVVTTINAIDADVNQSTFFVTMGVTDRFDLSLAVPLVATDLRDRVLGAYSAPGHDQSADPLLPSGRRQRRNRSIFTADGSATGLGDLDGPVEGQRPFRPAQRPRVGPGRAALDRRRDEPAGQRRGGPAAVCCLVGHLRRVLPARERGVSLERLERAGRRSRDRRVWPFPDQFSYALGADVSVNPRLTVALDGPGRYLIDASAPGRGLPWPRRRVHVPEHRVRTGLLQRLERSIGLKGNLFRRLLLDVNLLFALDENGLRDKVTPLIGFEFSF